MKTFHPKTIFDNLWFFKTWVDFCFKINAQGLILSSFESWGTETANYANFVRFSSVFNYFASETYKTRSLGYFLYFYAFLGVFKRFCSSDWPKMMSIYTLISSLMVLSSIFLHETFCCLPFLQDRHEWSFLNVLDGKPVTKFP